jgi:hypothetical protein
MKFLRTDEKTRRRVVTLGEYAAGILKDDALILDAKREANDDPMESKISGTKRQAQLSRASQRMHYFFLRVQAQLPPRAAEFGAS